MKVYLSTAAISLIVLTLCLGALAQNKAEAKEKYKSFCSGDNWSSDDRVSFKEVREMTIPATGSVNVDAGQNGGIRVTGENRSDVFIRACVQAWGKTGEAAKAAAGSIRIETGSLIKAEGDEGGNWSVSYEISVPRNTGLDLKAHNGGISIGGVDGDLTFQTTNGGVSLKEVAGSVKGATTNGGVVVSLNGSSWKGNGLDVTTTNGGVVLSIPDNFAAHVETGTVNGGFTSDFAALNIDRRDRSRPARVSADLNGGGAPIRVVTTNGGIRINSASSVKF